MFCPRCGKENFQEANYCIECAFPLRHVNRILSEAQQSDICKSNDITGSCLVQNGHQETQPEWEDPRKPYVRFTPPLDAPVPKTNLREPAVSPRAGYEIPPDRTETVPPGGPTPSNIPPITASPQKTKNQSLFEQSHEIQPAPALEASQSSWYSPPISPVPRTASGHLSLGQSGEQPDAGTKKRGSAITWIALCCGGIILLLIVFAGIISICILYASAGQFGSSSLNQTNCVLPSGTGNGFYSGDKVTQTFPYIVNGTQGSVSLPVYKQLRDYMACRSDELVNKTNGSRMNMCILGSCSLYNVPGLQRDKGIILESKNYSVAKPLADAIKLASSDPDMQVRIATSIVQQIPYDCEKKDAIFASNYSIFRIHERTPYEVLYDKSGICGEKSMLLALLVGELGYGSAILNFDDIHHGLAGIRGSGDDQYLNTSYILLETTENVPIGFNTAALSVNVAYPNITPVSTGAEFSLNDQEREDARNYLKLATLQKMHVTLTSQNVYQARDLINRYGTPKDSCSPLPVMTATPPLLPW